MTTRIAYGLMALALVAGCASPAIQSTEGPASLTLQPKIANGRMVQTVMSPYDATSINHLVVKLFKVTGGVESPVLDGASAQIQKDIVAANLATPIQFVKLHYNTTYRIKAYAYKASGTSDADLISDTASSSVDLAVAYNDRPLLSNLPVTLLDQAFNGQATASQIVVATGSLTTSTPATMSVVELPL